MDPTWDAAQGPRPHPPAVRVWELSWPGLQNPCPSREGLGNRGGQLLDEGLSPAWLQVLAQADDLSTVSALEMCVDTRERSLGSFGLHLPGLSQLKLSGSRLASVRDLGTSLGRLQVLWLARCGLADLDGMGSFPALKELYVSYNNVSDLSPLCLLEQLEVLDLEGNCVGDLEQVRYLQLCPRLATLTLEGNLVCQRPGPGPPGEAPRGYNYRAEVRKLVPQLQVLDEVPAAHTGLPAKGKLTRDRLMVTEAIKEGDVPDGLVPGLGNGLTVKQPPPQERPPDPGGGGGGVKDAPVSATLPQQSEGGSEAGGLAGRRRGPDAPSCHPALNITVGPRLWQGLDDLRLCPQQDVPTEPPHSSPAQRCPCPRPSPSPYGASSPRTQPQRMAPAASRTAPAMFSVGTPPEAFGSAEAGARPGNPCGRSPSSGLKTPLPAPPPWSRTLLASAGTYACNPWSPCKTGSQPCSACGGALKNRRVRGRLSRTATSSVWSQVPSPTQPQCPHDPNAARCRGTSLRQPSSLSSPRLAWAGTGKSCLGLGFPN